MPTVDIFVHCSGGKLYGSKQRINCTNYGYLVLDNIFDLQSKAEYDIILEVLRFIDGIFSPDLVYPENIDTYSIRLKQAIVDILNYQLSRNDNDKQFERLPEYGKQIISAYFNNRNDITLHYDHFVLESDWVQEVMNPVTMKPVTMKPDHYDGTCYCPY
eukprot:908540_1